MKIHYLSENTPSGALVSMDYGGPSCVMVTQMLLSVTDVEPRERHGVTLTKNMHNQADDLTTERAAIYKYHKVFDGYNFLSGPKGMEEIVCHDMELVSLDDHLAALKTARQEALREGAKVAREFPWEQPSAHADPLRQARCRGNREASSDIAAALDRLASEGA